jgi:hypothetical protein
VFPDIEELSALLLDDLYDEVHAYEAELEDELRAAVELMEEESEALAGYGGDVEATSVLCPQCKKRWLLCEVSRVFCLCGLAFRDTVRHRHALPAAGVGQHCVVGAVWPGGVMYSRIRTHTRTRTRTHRSRVDVNHGRDVNDTSQVTCCPRPVSPSPQSLDAVQHALSSAFEAHMSSGCHHDPAFVGNAAGGLDLLCDACGTRTANVC